jgi:hypothetical protein
MYKVADGWRIKGSDGVVHGPRQTIPLNDSDVERLLKLGAITRVADAQVSSEDEDTEAELPGGEDEDTDDTGNEGDGTGANPEVKPDDGEIPAPGGDIPDTQEGLDAKNCDGEPKGGRSRRPRQTGGLV